MNVFRHLADVPKGQRYGDHKFKNVAKTLLYPKVMGGVGDNILHGANYAYLGYEMKNPIQRLMGLHKNLQEQAGKVIENPEESADIADAVIGAPELKPQIQNLLKGQHAPEFSKALMQVHDEGLGALPGLAAKHWSDLDEPTKNDIKSFGKGYTGNVAREMAYGLGNDPWWHKITQSIGTPATMLMRPFLPKAPPSNTPEEDGSLGVLQNRKLNTQPLQKAIDVRHYVNSHGAEGYIDHVPGLDETQRQALHAALSHNFKNKVDYVQNTLQEHHHPSTLIDAFRSSMDGGY